MRTLASLGILSEDANHCFTLTSLGEALFSGSAGCLWESRGLGLQADWRQNHLCSSAALAGLGQARAAVPKGAARESVERTHRKWCAPFQTDGLSRLGTSEDHETSRGAFHNRRRAASRGTVG